MKYIIQASALEIILKEGINTFYFFPSNWGKGDTIFGKEIKLFTPMVTKRKESFKLEDEQSVPYIYGQLHSINFALKGSLIFKGLLMLL